MSTETPTIEHDGDTWRLLATGATRDGRTMCHLASTTRFTQQRNGAMPIQICDWLEPEKLRPQETPEQEDAEPRRMRNTPSS